MTRDSVAEHIVVRAELISESDYMAVWVTIMGAGGRYPWQTSGSR